MTDPTWFTELSAAGVLAVIVWLFMTGRLRTEKEVQRLIADRDRALELVYKNAAIAEEAIRSLEAAKKKGTAE